MMRLWKTGAMVPLLALSLAISPVTAPPAAASPAAASCMMTLHPYINQYDIFVMEKVPTVTLGEGSTGHCVTFLQQQLNAWDGKSHALTAPLYVDGKFGGHTLSAVKTFQRSNAYCAGPVDGLAGPNTMSCLEFYVSGG